MIRDLLLSTAVELEQSMTTCRTRGEILSTRSLLRTISCNRSLASDQHCLSRDDVRPARTLCLSSTL